jgi:peptidoglycan/xylan/chitin deacetylase (PgdA/CDA1 family)
LGIEPVKSFQAAALYIARFLGLFALAQHLTRRRLRILCYHGFSIGDEYQVAPNMFMRRQTFERRMRILKKRRIPVLPLDEAVERLKAGEISHAETVITFDDGWASNLTVAAPVLAAFRYPACVYVTTEHLAAGTEGFNVALYYLLHRSRSPILRLEGLHPALDGSYEIAADPSPLQCTLAEAAERAFPRLSERQQLLRPIAQALGMDLDEVLAGGRFRLLQRSEIGALYSRGVDIQLHTHTHNLPDDSFEKMAGEISQNRHALEEILGRVPTHFCYPSGKYHPQHLEWLAKLGIASATTCDPGLNDATTNPLQLRRYLDGDAVSDIVFEAEVSGLRELMRAARSGVRRFKNSTA